MNKSVYSIVIYMYLQGCSHQCSWSGFNWTNFRGNNHILANILEVDGVPSSLADQLATTWPQLTE